MQHAHYWWQNDLDTYDHPKNDHPGCHDHSQTLVNPGFDIPDLNYPQLDTKNVKIGLREGVIRFWTKIVFLDHCAPPWKTRNFIQLNFNTRYARLTMILHFVDSFFVIQYFFYQKFFFSLLFFLFHSVFCSYKFYKKDYIIIDFSYLFPETKFIYTSIMINDLCTVITFIKLWSFFVRTDEDLE